MSAQGKVYHCVASSPKKEEIFPNLTVVRLQVVNTPQYPAIREHVYTLSADTCTVAMLRGICSDLTWISICREAYPYSIGAGKSSKATCRSCGHQFEREELRIKTTLLCKMASESICPCQINMCSKLQCIKFLPSKWFTNTYQPWVCNDFQVH